MVIENDPSARMQLRSLGELIHPGSCMVCGSGNCDEGYIDLGVFFDYEGSQYLCKHCCYQAGETFGMYTPDEIRQTQELAEKLAAENSQLKAELADVRPVIDSLSNIFGVNVSVGPRTTLTSSEEPVTEPAASNFTPYEPGEGESESPKPIKGTGRSNSGGTKSRNPTFD